MPKGGPDDSTLAVRAGRRWISAGKVPQETHSPPWIPHVRAVHENPSGDFHDHTKKHVTATIQATLPGTPGYSDAHTAVDAFSTEGNRRLCHLGADREPTARVELQALRVYPRWQVPVRHVCEYRIQIVAYSAEGTSAADDWPPARPLSRSLSQLAELPLLPSRISPSRPSG